MKQDHKSQRIIINLETLYKLYKRFYLRGRKREDRITDLGKILIFIFFFSLFTGLNTNTSYAYIISVTIMCLLIFSFFYVKLFSAKIKITRNINGIYSVNNNSYIWYNIENRDKSDIRNIYVKEAEPLSVPDFIQFKKMKEPKEDSRNFWDRKFLYYRWLWLIRKKQGIQCSENRSGIIKKRRER